MASTFAHPEDDPDSDKPDADIPALEIAFLRAVFTLSTPLTISKSIKRFERSSEGLLQIVNDHDVDFLSRPIKVPRLLGMYRSDCDWTILMVIDYLSKHSDFIFKSILSLVVEGPPVSSLQSWRNLEPDDANYDCLDQFQEAVWHNVSMANNLLQSGKFRRAGGAIDHPIYGYLSAAKLLHLASFESWIRKRQVQKIMAIDGVV